MAWTCEITPDADNPAVGTGVLTFTDPDTHEVFTFPAKRAAAADVEDPAKLAAWVASMKSQLAAARAQRALIVTLEQAVEAALNA